MLTPPSVGLQRDGEDDLARPSIIETLSAAVFLAVMSLSPAMAAGPAVPTPGESLLAWSPDEQAWGYRNMEKVAPVKVIPRGDHVRALPLGRSIDPTFTAGGKTYDTATYMAAFRASGILVLKDGKIVLERYSLGRGPNDRWTSFSVAKSVTSTLIGAAIKDGKIGAVTDPVTRYIPELKGSAYDGVTIRDLITMSSGVKWNEDYADPKSDVAKVGLSMIEPGVNPVISYMRRLPRAHPPGTFFEYDTGETDLAGILLSNAVGEPTAQYLSEKIWRPYGMEQDGIWVEDVAGHERGGCCISMTLRDYGRFGQFVLDGGQAGGRSVLPDGWIAEATARHLAPAPYGYFWWLLPGGYEAEGIFGQTVTIFPQDHIVVVINSAWSKAWDEDIDAVRLKYLAAIRGAASGG